MSNVESTRAVFEGHMRKQNACVHLGRQKTDGSYRTVSVQRAWMLWCAALTLAVDEYLYGSST